MNTALLSLAIDFYNEGNSMAATAREFRSTPNTLKKLFIKQGVHIRGQREQLIIENKRRAKKIDHYYFATPTLENMYYAGFLAADGTVRKDKNEVKVALSSVDTSFLEEFRQHLKSERAIKTYMTNNGFECCELCFTSAVIKQDLAQYGIVPNKTHIGLSLKLIPQEFRIAYIKGFFDGDGSFSYNKQTKQCKISFTSHTKEILLDIMDYLGLGGGIYQDKRTQVYSLEYSTSPSLQIMSLFYSIDTPCLKRKQKKYLECLDLRNTSPRDRTPSTEG